MEGSFRKSRAEPINNRQIVCQIAAGHNKRWHRRDPTRRMPLALERSPANHVMTYLVVCGLILLLTATRAVGTFGNCDLFRTARCRLDAQRIPRIPIEPREIQPGSPPLGYRKRRRPHVIFPRPNEPLGQRMTTTRSPTPLGRLAPARARRTRIQLIAVIRHAPGRHRHSGRGHRKRRQQHAA